VEGCCSDTLYELYQKLQLQFDVLLMMGAIGNRNMQSNFAVNKHLHNVASLWFLLMKSHDARNQEYKIHLQIEFHLRPYEKYGSDRSQFSQNSHS